MRPDLKPFISIIAGYSELLGVDANLIKAIIMIESAGVPGRTRFEPDWRYLYFHRDHADRLGITEMTERLAQMHSYGLMQVMGSVAREMGFDGYLHELCKPELGISYGAKKLKSLMIRYGEEVEVVAAYNAGSVRRTKGGLFENQPYVDKVYQELRKYRVLV